MKSSIKKFIIFCSSGHIRVALQKSFFRLNPIYQIQNPIMFVVYLCAVLMTIDLMFYNTSERTDPINFIIIVNLVLWFTVLFSNFAEAIAEALAQEQTEPLKGTQIEVKAKLLTHSAHLKKWKEMPARFLEPGDLVLVEAGDFIPTDGTVMDGIATVDESAITGESAPVIRESGGERDSVVNGTRVLSDWIVVKVTSTHEDSYIAKMLSMVEGHKRPKTPVELALNIFLLATTIITIISCTTLYPFTHYSTLLMNEGIPVTPAFIITLIVCLVPTTIGSLMSPIGISGMRRLLHARILSTSGQAIEASADITIALFDKTGTITYGNRQATAFFPAQNIGMQELAEAAFLSSCADKTPEGTSITELAFKHLDSRPPIPTVDFTFIPFSAETRASGITIGENRAILKGAADVVEAYVSKLGGSMPPEVTLRISTIARQGGTPLVVADGPSILGVIFLKDVVKPEIKDKIMLLRKLGVQSVMITGDNPITAAAIASEAGVDDFIAQATPETKLNFIQSMQEDGQMIAMIGDGTNDAPALSQADVGIVMNSGTQAAKEAGNMIDLDSSPAKLAQIVWIGRQLAITRGAMTTFTLASDLSKYLAIISAVFVHSAPSLSVLNFLHLSTPYNAMLAALIFNALSIVILTPLALQGSAFKTRSPGQLLRNNILLYGVGGFIFSLLGLKLVDWFILLFNGGLS